MNDETTKSALDWRWMALGLLALNIAAGFAFLFTRPTVEPEAVQVPPLDDGVNQPRLVSEVMTVAQVDTIGPECFTIGPLPTLLAQQRGEERLRPFVSELRLRQTSADHDRGWWVYLPAASRSEALQLTRQLAEAEVEDYYVVAGGDMENSVSVGLYQNVDNARNRQTRIRALGFDAQMEVRRERIPQFWLDYRVEPGEDPPWRFILRASPGAQRLAIPCFRESGSSETTAEVD